MTDSQELEEASTALTQWLSPEHCYHLIAAVISKYIALTPEELQEWQVSFNASQDVFPMSKRLVTVAMRCRVHIHTVRPYMNCSALRDVDHDSS